MKGSIVENTRDANLQKYQAINEQLRYEPDYGKSIALWIYAPALKKYVRINEISGEPVFYIYDVTNAGFIKALTWLNCQGLFFLPDVDPNEDLRVNGYISPISFPESFLKQFGIISSVPHKVNDPIDHFMEARRNNGGQYKDENKRERIQAQKEEIAQQLATSSKSGLEKVIEELSSDWQDIHKYSSGIRLIIKMKGYILEESDGKLRIQPKD